MIHQWNDTTGVVWKNTSGVRWEGLSVGKGSGLYQFDTAASAHNFVFASCSGSYQFDAASSAHNYANYQLPRQAPTDNQ